MQRMRRVLVILILAAAVRIGCAAEPVPYVDPQGDLALLVPAGWQLHREEEPPVVSTEVSLPRDGPIARAYLLSVASRGRLTAAQLPALAATLTKIGTAALRQDLHPLSTTSSDILFHGRPAVRTDVRASLGDDVYVAHFTVVLGKSHAYLLAAAASEKDAAGMAAAEQIVDSVGLETDRPMADRGLFTAASIAQVAAEIRDQRKADAAVLLPGEPPLTAGALRQLAAAAEQTQAMHLTVAEEEQLRQAMESDYRRASGSERASLVAAGARLGVPRTGPHDLPGRDTSSWAGVLAAAVERRNAILSPVRGVLPTLLAGEPVHTHLTDGDTDAAAEMLLFMWIAAGRPVQAVTPASLTATRDLIGIKFPVMASDEQYLFANASRVYAGVRAAWKSAPAERRAVMARSFGEVLDALGLREIDAPPAPPSSPPTTSGPSSTSRRPFERFEPDNTRAVALLAICWAFAAPAAPPVNDAGQQPRATGK